MLISKFVAHAQEGRRSTRCLGLFAAHQQIGGGNLVEHHLSAVLDPLLAVDLALLLAQEFMIHDLAIIIQTGSVKCHNRLYHLQNLRAVIRLLVATVGALPLYTILPSQEAR